MEGLWLENNRPHYRNDIPVSNISANEALVKLRLAGICATDLEMIKGYYPFTGVMGHEFVGEIVAAPSAPNRVGERVVGEINAACGQCLACRAGRPTHCEHRTVLGISNHNGCFAQYLALPIENLHLVPPQIPDEAAVFTEPLAAALEILEQVHITPSERVLIIGAGRLGQLISQVLALSGCDLVVVARHAVQRQILTSRKIRCVEADEIESQSIDVVVEATGNPHGFNLARQVVRPRGKIVLKSTYASSIELNLSPMVVNEITLIGSRCGPFPPALRLLNQGLVDPLPLIAAHYSLKTGLQALDYAAQPGILKVLIHP